MKKFVCRHIAPVLVGVVTAVTIHALPLDNNDWLSKIIVVIAVTAASLIGYIDGTTRPLTRGV